MLAESYLDPADHTSGVGGYIRRWDGTASAPYLFGADDGIWIGYDDPASLRVKARLVELRGMRGVMAWDLASDDCNDTLARTVNEALGREVAQAPGCGGAPAGEGEGEGAGEGEGEGEGCPDPGTGECWSIGPWCGDAGMTQWCNDNCPQHCPPTHCRCP